MCLLDVVFYEELITILRETFPKQEILFHFTNITEKDSVERAFREIKFRFNTIDFLIAAAGILNESEYELTVDVNFVSQNCMPKVN